MKKLSLCVIGVLMLSGFAVMGLSTNVSASAPTITNYGVIPTRIDSGGTFTGWLTYTSNENQTPTYVKMQRFLGPIMTDNVTMIANDTGDTDYTGPGGKQYYYNWYFFPYITASNLFKFQVKSDGYVKVTVSVSGTKSSIPFPRIYNENVFPTDNSETNYTFCITYWHTYNYAPYTVQVAIDGVFHNMIANDTGDTVYSDGKNYYFFQTLSPGLHTFQFFVQDFAASGNYTHGESWLIVQSSTINVSIGVIALIACLAAVIVFLLMRW